MVTLVCRAKYGNVKRGSTLSEVKLGSVPVLSLSTGHGSSNKALLINNGTDGVRCRTNDVEILFSKWTRRNFQCCDTVMVLCSRINH